MKVCPKCSDEFEDAVEVCPNDKAQLKTPERDALVGTRLANRYDVKSVLGKGGMGVVYRANDEQTDRIVAIKMLHSHKVADSEALKRFNREARTVAQVNHHHIVTLFDFGMHRNQPYIVMDFLQGRSLKDEMQKCGPLPFDRASKIFTQTFEALEFAHCQHVVHRDLKPENIILCEHRGQEDYVKIVDFGLSKLREDADREEMHIITKAGDVCGSPPYMSPEQCYATSVVDPRSDIYSMAILVYEVLSGKLPYKAKSAIEMMDCHLYAQPIPFCDAAPELKNCNETTYVLKKALSKEPENRYQTCTEFQKELSDALRRDWPKVRSYRYRLEDVTFQNLEAEADALQTGEHPALNVVQQRSTGPNNSVREVIEEFNKETAVHKDHEPQFQYEEDDRHMEEEEQREGILAKLMSFFRRDTAQEDEDAEFEQKYGYSNCPFCNAPIKARLRFCVNCQRQLPSAQECAKLRLQSGRFMSKARSSDEPKGFSQRAKMRSHSSGMSGIMKIVTLVLIAAIGYGGWMLYTDKQMQKKVTTFVKHLK